MTERKKIPKMSMLCSEEWICDESEFGNIHTDGGEIMII